VGEERLRLAFIKKQFIPHGGGERYLQTLMTGLRERGHDLHIYASAWSAQKGVTFHEIRTLSLTSHLSTVTFARNACRQLRGSERPDCVVSFERTDCQDIYRAGEGCHAEWLRIRSRFAPLHKRLSFRLNPLHRSLLRLERALFSHTPLIVTNSAMVSTQIREHYPVPEERIRILYNGVDLVRFSPDNRARFRAALRGSLGLSADTPVLLFIGSGFERKGLRTVIAGLSYLEDRNMRLLVVGRGDAGPSRSLAESLGIGGRVLFLGAQADVVPFYSAADLFVLPTWYDPFSNATLEAMASGLPVITTANNGVSELITNGREGHVMRTLSDPRELADLVDRSRGNLLAMGTRARLRAEEFSIERAVNEFTCLIGEDRP